VDDVSPKRVKEEEHEKKKLIEELSSIQID
jgi:hypothetical protein